MAKCILACGLLLLLAPSAVAQTTSGLADSSGPFGQHITGSLQVDGPIKGDISGTSVTATGGTAAASLSVLVPLNLRSFGAKCDGTTNDSGAVTSALTAGSPLSLLQGGNCNASSILWTAVPGVWRGAGGSQIKTSDGNLRGPLLSEVTSAPSQGNHASPQTFFNGNWAGVGIAHEHIIAGVATLGQPAAGYSITPEAAAEVVEGYSTSGWNQSLSGNGGRTGAMLKYLVVNQYGQGDFTATWCNGTVASTLANATSYLAEPAIECLGGQLNGSQAGQYIEYLGDMNITDNGADIAAAGAVWNLSRTNGAEGIGANWLGVRINSSGSVPVDDLTSYAGPFTRGLNLANANLAWYRLAGYSINAGGSGYVVGDTITVSGGTAITPTTWTVATVDGSGAVLTLTLVNSGIYSSAPNSLVSFTTLTVTGGTGTGLTMSGQYSGNLWALLPSTGGCVMPSGSGSAVAGVTGINSVLCIANNGVSFGALGTNQSTAPAGANNAVFGTQNLSVGSGSYQFGTQSYDLAQQGGMYFAFGNFAGQGDAERSWKIFRATITSQTRLTSNGGAATTQNSLLMVRGIDNVAFECAAVDTTNGDYGIWKRRGGALSLPVTAGTVSYNGDASTTTAPDYSGGAGSGATLQLAADNTLKTLNITIVPPGATGHTWRGACAINSVHIGF